MVESVLRRQALKKRLQSLLLIGSVFALLGCEALTFEESEKEDQNKFVVIHPESLEQQIARFEERFKITVRPNQTIELYNVDLRWQPLKNFKSPERYEYSQDVSLEIVRSYVDPEAPRTHAADHYSPIVHLRSGQMRDLVLQGERVSYLVRLRDLNTFNVILSFVKTVEIPRDLHVTAANGYRLMGDRKWDYHRILLEDGARVILGPHNLDIKAHEIRSEGLATFVTFEDGGRIARRDEDGLSGGSVEVEAYEMIGTFEFDLRGQDGGAGSNGAPIRPATAEKGRDAGRGREVCLTPVHRGLEGLGPALGMPKFCTCNRRGRDATNGADGRRGNPGSAGGNAGDGGSLVINATLGTQAAIGNRNLRGGQGGPGGVGGPGQKGGEGGRGAGSRGIKASDCRGQSGQDGKDGARGRKGADGQDGLLGRLCLQFDDAPGKSECGDLIF